jgi:hypothetical protein
MYWYVNKKRIPVKIHLLPGGELFELSFPFDRDAVDEVKAMERPENSWQPHKKTWLVRNSRRNRASLDFLAKGEIYRRFMAKIPTTVYDGLWAHQNDMLNRIMTRRRFIIAGEMRTGKTLPALLAIKMSGVKHAYWVAPKAGQRGVKREFVKWDVTTPITLLTYEKFRILWLKNELPLSSFFVFDECQALKEPTSKVTKCALSLSEAMEQVYDNAEYVVELSGTPSPKNPGDWWSLCEICQPGIVRESSRKQFEYRMAVYEDTPFGKKIVGWKDDEVEKLYRRLRPIVAVYLKKDCLDIPPITYEVADLEPSEEMLRVAETIVNTELHHLTAVNKLRQLSDGFMYQKEYDYDANATVRTGKDVVGGPKLARLAEDLDEHKSVGRLIVYAGFQGSVDMITDLCVEKGWTVLKADGRGWSVHPETDVSVDLCLAEMDRSTNKHIIDNLVFVANPGSGGVGIELSASPTIIYYSNTNKGADRMQSEARAHSNNMDKNRGLTVIDYCHLPTDYTIRERLIEKRDLQSMSMGELRKSLNRREHSPRGIKYESKGID